MLLYTPTAHICGCVPARSPDLECFLALWQGISVLIDRAVLWRASSLPHLLGSSARREQCRECKVSRPCPPRKTSSFGDVRIFRVWEIGGLCRCVRYKDSTLPLLTWRSLRRACQRTFVCTIDVILTLRSLAQLN